MEKQSSGLVPPHAAQEQLRAARRAHDGSVRRATPPAGLILATSALCGAMTFSPSHKGLGQLVTIICVTWFVLELMRLSARNQWHALRSLPRPRWSFTEFALIVVAVLVGALVGPDLLASRDNSVAASVGLGAAVAVTVAACLFAANASYRRRAAKAWQR